MLRPPRSRAPTFVGVFVGGGIGGVLLDQIHVRTHVLRYPHPDLAGQPWWVAPQFGIAALAIFAVALAVPRKIGRDTALGDGIVFIVAYLVTGVFHRHPGVVLVVLLVLWVGRLLAHRDRASVIVLSVGLAIAGPVYESFLSRTGAFHYSVDHLLAGVPLWLPALYLNGGVLAASVARALGAADTPATAHG